MRAAAIKLWDIPPQIRPCFVIFNREFARFFVITKIKFAHFFVFLLVFVIKCVYYNREKIEMRPVILDINEEHSGLFFLL